MALTRRRRGAEEPDAGEPPRRLMHGDVAQLESELRALENQIAVEREQMAVEREQMAAEAQRAAAAEQAWLAKANELERAVPGSLQAPASEPRPT